MVNSKRGKPQKWSDEELKKIALEVKYSQPHLKLTWVLLETKTGIGRNTWSRRMKDFINQLNSPVHIPRIDDSGIITIPSVEELFSKYGSDKIELKNEIAKLLNIISDLYADAKQLAVLKDSISNMKLDIEELKNKLDKVTSQKIHFETLYYQIVAESYFPHLYERSEKLKQANVKGVIIPLPIQKKEALKLDNPFSVFNNELDSLKKQDSRISELNKMFNLDIE